MQRGLLTKRKNSFKYLNSKFLPMNKVILTLSIAAAIVTFSHHGDEYKEVLDSELSLLENRHFIDLSESSPNDTIRYSFKFQNVGDKVLNILSVETSCTCTAPSFTKQIDPEHFGYINLVTTAGQLRDVKEVYAVIKSNSKARFAKVSLVSQVK
jgi:hypothetical protein